MKNKSRQLIKEFGNTPLIHRMDSILINAIKGFDKYPNAKFHKITLNNAAINDGEYLCYLIAVKTKPLFTDKNEWAPKLVPKTPTVEEVNKDVYVKLLTYAVNLMISNINDNTRKEFIYRMALTNGDEMCKSIFYATRIDPNKEYQPAVRINESQLRQIVKETICQILNL